MGPPASAEEGKATYPPIAEYALVGDGRCAGLVSAQGSVDWLCLPRFDSPSVFAAILDARRGGRFSVRPAEAFRTERRYLGASPVVETVFLTAGGTARLLDLMPVYPPEVRRTALCPEREWVRVVEGVAGEVVLDVCYEPRPDYGRRAAGLRRRGRKGLVFEDRGDALYLWGDVPLEVEAGRAVGRFTLAAGARMAFSLVYARGEPLVLPAGNPMDRVEDTRKWWERWADRCTYRGPYRDAVVRSAVTLKLLTYAPSGAPVAAPTTSLPEDPGGVRNWDYRYCWLRDASMTLRAFTDLGYQEEGEAYLSWLLHTTRLSRPELRVLYDVYGETRLAEEELDLEGYAASRPVRVGNGAGDQFQLDVYGEVADAAYRLAQNGGHFDRSTRRMLRGLGETVCRRWREPDDGIWEVRRPRRHHTHSRVMCWVALDRLLTLGEMGRLEVPREEFSRERDRIRAEVESQGWNEGLGSYVGTFGGDEVDAALLLLPLYGYVEASSERMRGTLDRVWSELSEEGLLYRYRRDGRDGLPGREGAFAVCSLWYVDCLARQGRREEATDHFERFLARGNDLGLFAEEIDPATGAALGNFPQAFTHVGIIHAALALAGQEAP